METKKDIRKKIRAARAALLEDRRSKYSECIQRRLLEHPLYQQAEEIYCYVSFGDEVCTDLILQTSWELGKRVAVPKILTEIPRTLTDMQEMQRPMDDTLPMGAPCRRYMEFFYLHSREELEEGYYGILEPVTRKKADGKTALVVMPGVAFDSSCHRIGYGGGFYDSYLSLHPGLRTIALAYSIQCMEQIPFKEHDIRPEMIITEKEIYTC